MTISSHYYTLQYISIAAGELAADHFNVCTPVREMPVAMYCSGSTGAFPGEHLQIRLVIRNTCFSDGPLSVLQIPVFCLC